MRNQFLNLYMDAGEWESAGSGALTGAATGAALGPEGAVVGGLVGGAVGLFEGISQKKKADALAKNNPYPQQDVPQAVKDNQEIAKQAANEGLPAQVYANASKNIQRGQAAALRSATDRRSGVGLIGQIQGNTTDAFANLDAQNAQARLANQRQLISVNSQAGAYQNQAFDWNQKNKYLQNYQYQMALRGAGNANIVGGIDKSVAALMPLIGGVFGGGGGGGSKDQGQTISDTF
jgi:hypothetical protein